MTSASTATGAADSDASKALRFVPLGKQSSQVFELKLIFVQRTTLRSCLRSCIN